jgi:TonB family protein
MKVSRFVAVAFLVLAFAAAYTAAAQVPALDPLAGPMAEAIVEAKRNSVIVLDFSGPDQKYTALGQALAENFSTALSKSSDKFSVAARGQISESRAKTGVPPSALNDIGIVLWVASELKVESVVVGKITQEGDRLGIAVECYRVDSGKWINGFKTTSTISAEMRELMNKVVEYVTPQPDPTIPVSGKSGYTYPTCVRCPLAKYDGQSAPHRYVGTVILSAVIKADGNTDDIVVLKALPYGLTAKAIEAVKSWKFSPARDPRGNPAAVRQVINVTFHLD